MSTVTYGFQQVGNTEPFAPWSNDPDSNQTQSAVTALAGGGFLLAAANRSYPAAFTSRTIMSIMDNDGQAASPTPFLAVTSQYVQQWNPQVAGLAGGGAVAVFTAINATPDQIRMQRFDAQGNPLGDDLILGGQNYGKNYEGTEVHPDSRDLSHPDVAGLKDGGYVVTWERAYSATDHDIAVAIFNADGTQRALFSPALTFASETDPHVAALTTGGFVETWTKDVGGDTQLWVQRFNSNGVPLGQAVLVDAVGAHNDQSDVVGLPDGGFAIAYRDSGWTGSTGNHDISLAIYNSNGSLRTIVNANAGFSGSDQDQPAITVLSNGFIAVGWTSSLDQTTDAAIFDANGKLILHDPGAFPGSHEMSLAGFGHGRLIGATTYGLNLNQDPLVIYAIQDLVRTTTGTGAGETLTGDDLRDVINGMGGSDTLEGKGGNDVLDGGAGIDTAVFSGSEGDYEFLLLPNGDVQVTDVTPNAPNGIDIVRNVEILSFDDGNFAIGALVAANSPVVAQPLADQVVAVNHAVGFKLPAGAFTDNDPLTYTAALAGGGALPAWLTFDGATRAFSGTPPQNFIGELDIKVTASDGQDSTSDVFRLTISNDGNDVLISGPGTGTTGVGDIFPLIGGGGDDVYVVADETAAITEKAGAGADTVYAAVTYTLPDNVEGLVLQEAGGAIDGFGSDGNDTIIGNSFANWLHGGGGHDALIGGGGDDVLDGGAEADGMAGGMGDDTYVVDNMGEQIQENAGEGTDTVYASVSFALPENVEGLVLLEGAGAINGAGSDGQDTIFGNSDNNVLDGRGGSDALIGGGGEDVLIGGADIDGMAGGLGDDIYVVDDAADQANENAGEGADTVYALASYTLAANLEGLVLVDSAGAINGSANGGDNYIFGNASANTLHGYGGQDVMFGGGGMDILNGDGGNDVLTGGAGNDLFWFWFNSGSGFGHDSIEDFTAGDQIVFSPAVFADFAAVQAHMVVVDASTTAILFDNDNTLSVHHAPGVALTQNDFLFM